MALTFATSTHPHFTDTARIAEINTDPGFGNYFTDHMALAIWDEGRGWHDDVITDYAPFGMNPAGAVYHYAQEVFEGLKAYLRADGSIWFFRPEANAARMIRSAERMALPSVPVDDFLSAVRNLVKTDARWVPGADEQSLYVRPFLIAYEDFLGVRPAKTVAFCVIASPVGAYFSGGVAPVDIWVSNTYARVANGGTGSAKCGGNYAAAMLPQEQAYEHGCSQVIFTDAATHTTIEELGGMNFGFITADKQLVTPALNGNILAGVTRDSILKVAPKLGLTPVERTVTMAEVKQGITDGSIAELFACGTAAVITPIGALRDETGEWRIDTPSSGTATLTLREYLLDVQYGRRADEFGWTERVC
jgi:branched-chain amino acid aminotransferase